MANGSVISTSSGKRVRLFAAENGDFGWESPPFSPSSTAVVVQGATPADDKVFVGSSAGAVHWLDLGSGTQKSQVSGATGPVWGIAFADGVVYANAADALVAYDVGSQPGSLLWSHPMGGHSWGSPFVANGIVYAGSWDSQLYAINTNGTPAWVSTAFDFWAAQPIVVNGVVFAAAWENLVALDAKTGTVLWHANTPNGATIVSPVAFGDGRIYVGTAWGARLYAFDAANGNLLWSSNFGGHPTPPTYRDGRVFASSENGASSGYLKAFDAADGQLSWISQVPVADAGDAVSRAVFDEGAASQHAFVESQKGLVCAFRRIDGSLAWQFGIEDMWPLDPVWTSGGPEPPFHWKHPEQYVSIDPLALVLRSDIYVKLKLPYPPPIERIAVRVRQATSGMEALEKRNALAQLVRVEMVARALIQAITTEKGQQYTSARSRS